MATTGLPEPRSGTSPSVPFRKRRTHLPSRRATLRAARASHRSTRASSIRAKRLLDIAGAIAGGLVLSPVLAAVAVAILVTDGRPILFRQMRPGRHGRPFEIVKFRTMRRARRDESWFATDEVRVTRIGRILRSTSLDELPELWNVLKGEMSLVGPRPLFWAYLQAYTAEERRRHDVRPGITGWAAVNGRHTLRFADRLALDVWYVDHWSLRLDLGIIKATILQVLHREHVSATQDFDEIDVPDRFRIALERGEHAPIAVSPHPGGTGG